MVPIVTGICGSTISPVGTSPPCVDRVGEERQLDEGRRDDGEDEDAEDGEDPFAGDAHGDSQSNSSGKVVPNASRLSSVGHPPQNYGADIASA